MTKEKLKNEAREYLAEHSEYSEVFEETFVAVDTLTAMVDFAEQETKELEAQIEKMKRCEICKHYRWNHCSYEINISEDCIQNKLKHFELKEIKENDKKRNGLNYC